LFRRRVFRYLLAAHLPNEPRLVMSGLVPAETRSVSSKTHDASFELLRFLVNAEFRKMTREKLGRNWINGSDGGKETERCAENLQDILEYRYTKTSVLPIFTDFVNR